MRIAEIFYSIQGEGKFSGVPSAFVRVSGCNLRCVWCDTPYASWNPEGPEMGVEEIVREVERHAARHVVLTGGEPMMFKEIVPLIQALHDLGKHVTVETAGTIWQEGLGAGVIDLLSVSPKLGNSTPWEREGGRFAKAHEEQRENVALLARLAGGGEGSVRACQWKFVVTSPGDVAEIEGLMGKVNERLEMRGAGKIWPADILLMPEGVDAESITAGARGLTELCKSRGYRLAPRWHIYWFGHVRGT